MGGFPAEDVYAMARMIGLPAREKTVKTVVAMGSLGDAAKSLVLEHNLSLAVVEQLLSFEEEETSRHSPHDEPPQGDKQLLPGSAASPHAMKVRQGRVDLLQWEGVKDMEELIRELKRATRPLLAGYEERLRRIREASALPPHIRIQVDPVFEKESIDIQVRARNAAEVDEALKKLEALSKQGVFRSIFELTHGTPGRD